MLEEKEEEDEGAKPSPAPSQPLASLLAAIHEEASNQSTIPLDDGAPTSTTRSSSPRSSRSGRRGKQRHISSSPSHSTPPRPTRTSPRISSRTRSTTSTATTPLPPSSNTSTLPSSTSSTPSLPAHQQQHMPRQAQDYQSPATQTTIAATGTVGAATTALPRATPPEVVVAAMVQNLAGTHVTFPPNSDWATVPTNYRHPRLCAAPKSPEAKESERSSSADKVHSDVQPELPISTRRRGGQSTLAHLSKFRHGEPEKGLQANL